MVDRVCRLIDEPCQVALALFSLALMRHHHYAGTG